MSQPVTQHPDVQLEESGKQLAELDNIHTHAQAMLNATHAIVGTPDWKGPAADTAATVVAHFIKNTGTALDDMTHRVNNVKNLAHTTQEQEAQYHKEISNMPLPSFHR